MPKPKKWTDGVFERWILRLRPGLAACAVSASFLATVGRLFLHMSDPYLALPVRYVAQALGLGFLAALLVVIVSMRFGRPLVGVFAGVVVWYLVSLCYAVLRFGIPAIWLAMG